MIGQLFQSKKGDKCNYEVQTYLMGIKYWISTLILIISFSTVAAQNSRINSNNTIGWFNYFGTFKLDKKFSIHSEYQWRREDYVINWQQSLLRVGLNYQVKPSLQFRVGYAWIETFPYDEIPINGLGRDFTEHRIFQAATLSGSIEKWHFSHRFMLEQRWIGTYSDPTKTSEDEYLFLNRLRYMFRLQMPLKGNSIVNNTPYLAAYNEIFIGFGSNVNENVFDQNRIGLLLGYRFSDHLRIEGGYLNQTLQLGREVEGRNVFQNNNGFIINTYLDF